jgi:hypothetical protein
MKILLITLSFLILVAAKSKGQSIVPVELASGYTGKTITVWDTITSVNVINANYARLTIDKGNPHDRMIISLKCREAAKMATYLNGREATVKGIVRQAELGTVMTVINIRDIDAADHIIYKIPQKKKL